MATTRAEMYEKFELRLAVRKQISDLPETQANVMWLMLDYLAEGRKLNITEMAGELGLAYTTFYDNFSRALEQLEVSLVATPEVAAWLTEHPRKDKRVDTDRPVASLLDVLNH